MKYFIDFEATQYTNEIIQIGCVREDGETFQSLIKPRKIEKVTKWITELTGITKSMLRKADNSDQVFEKFCDWLLSDKTPAMFFCYGGSDLVFVNTNIDKCTKSVKAQMGLSIIAANLTDVTELVKEHFNLSSAPALKKVMTYYYPNDNHEWHDAQSDADMLRMVYEAMQNERVLNGIPKIFEQYVKIQTLSLNSKQLDQLRVVRHRSNSSVFEKFDTIGIATDKIVSEIQKAHGDVPNVTMVKSRILAAINNKSKYCGYEWTIELKTI